MKDDLQPLASRVLYEDDEVRIWDQPIEASGPRGGGEEGEMCLDERLEELGRLLGKREAPHGAALERARARAEQLRVGVARALEHFLDAARATGAPFMDAEVSAVRLDDKHLRAFQFELRRGQHRAIVTVKSRAEVTLVGPFRAGKAEGPCRSFPLEESDEFANSLSDFVSAFVEQAASP